MIRPVHRWILIAALVASFSAGSSAQTPVSSPVPLSLTLEDAVARGLREHVATRLGEAEVVTARGARWTALQDLLPTASAKVGMTRQVINLHALYESKSGAADLRAAELDMRDTRALVSLGVRNLYLQAVADQSRLKAARAQVETAQALLTQATDLKNAGVVAGIDVVRAQVQARTQEQRAILAENEYEKGKLQLARAIGVPLGQPLLLTDAMP